MTMRSAQQSKEKENISELERACIKKGMKMTEQRRVIARVLSESTDHPDVEEVYHRATQYDPRISIATVYRTLRLFDIANIIDRLEFGDGRARYEMSDQVGHHHHLIDMKTGQVVEFEEQHRKSKNSSVIWSRKAQSARYLIKLNSISSNT